MREWLNGKVNGFVPNESAHFGLMAAGNTILHSKNVL